ncbi:hypothetical protein GCM10009774_33230 [Cellulomonas gelida]|uniref:Uncharacterized protein n=1 Tax=Cellulomonas gelida TaxID=1712 RepID=A0A4Y3KNV9_9CELL|nr:hypothetical protein CGE01nite_20860 [Cellulomonas gelida]GGL39890.1 hypothetical protein GCM10009774_33230 [Cellulomonas gelida]
MTASAPRCTGPALDSESAGPVACKGSLRSARPRGGAIDDEVGRLAERVAAAADAWLRDPQDAGVYRRLVDAVLAWRTVTRAQLDLVDPSPGATTVAERHADPQMVRGALADVVDELRRRSTGPDS